MQLESGSERRKFIRANYPCKVILHNPERVLDTNTENISAGGVRVILNQKVQEHELVGIEIYLTDTPVKCEGRVVWVIEHKTEFDSGIEFYEINDKDRMFMDEFIQRLVNQEGHNGR